MMLEKDVLSVQFRCVLSVGVHGQGCLRGAPSYDRVGVVSCPTHVGFHRYEHQLCPKHPDPEIQ